MDPQKSCFRPLAHALPARGPRSITKDPLARVVPYQGPWGALSQLLKRSRAWKAAEGPPELDR